jgi:predicted transcriptional regulator
MAEATTTITVRIPVSLKEKMDLLAAHTQRSRSYLAAEALEIYTRYELEIVEGILEAIAEVDAGKFYTSEQMAAELEKLRKRSSKAQKTKATRVTAE